MNKTPVIYDPDPADSKSVWSTTKRRSPPASKQKAIPEKFRGWVFADPDRKPSGLVRVYNDTLWSPPGHVV